MEDLFKGLENVKDKKMNSVVNEYDTFSTSPGEYVASVTNLYQILVKDMIAHGITGTPVEHNLKFINILGKGWGNVNSCLQSNGSLNKLTIFQLFDELQGHESNVAQTLRELSGGPLDLVRTINTPPLSHAPSDPNLYSQLSEEFFDPKAAFEELRFQKEFTLLTMKYKRP